MSGIKAGAPECGLYFKFTASDFKARFSDIRQAIFVINRDGYEKNMHVIEITPDEGSDGESIKAHVQFIVQSGFVALIRDDIDLAKAMDADGVVLSDADDVQRAAKVLDTDFIIGLDVGENFDLAKAHIIDLDMVAFSSGAGEALCLKWKALSDNPALVYGGLTADNCERYIRAGAQFVEAQDYILDHDEGVMQGVVNLLDAIEQASDAPVSLN